MAITDFDDSSGGGAAPAHPADSNSNTSKMGADLHRWASRITHMGGVDATALDKEVVDAYWILVEFRPAPR